DERVALAGLVPVPVAPLEGLLRELLGAVGVAAEEEGHPVEGILGLPHERGELVVLRGCRVPARVSGTRPVCPHGERGYVIGVLGPTSDDPQRARGAGFGLRVRRRGRGTGGRGGWGVWGVLLGGHSLQVVRRAGGGAPDPQDPGSVDPWWRRPWAPTRCRR